jgi:polyisoprenoid-binding protein YceI
MREEIPMTMEHIAQRSAGTIRPGRYRLEPGSTTVAFSAKKFGLFTIRGTIEVVEGTLTVASPLELSSLHALLAADTFRTPMGKRDEHVKGKALLDVATYPFIEFDSTAVTAVDGGWEVRGLLSVHGTVAPAVLGVLAASAESGRVRISAAARVDRRAFGVTGMRVAAASYVDVQIEAVGVPAGGGGTGL